MQSPQCADATRRSILRPKNREEQSLCCTRSQYIPWLDAADFCPRSPSAQSSHVMLGFLVGHLPQGPRLRPAGRRFLTQLTGQARAGRAARRGGGRRRQAGGEPDESPAVTIPLRIYPAVSLFLAVLGPTTSSLGLSLSLSLSLSRNQPTLHESRQNLAPRL